MSTERLLPLMAGDTAFVRHLRRRLVAVMFDSDSQRHFRSLQSSLKGQLETVFAEPDGGQPVQ